MVIDNAQLKRAKERKGVLIAAHRGTCGGNIIQNTALAYECALAHGADMIEIDVIRSADGEFFAFHNGQEKFIFNRDIEIFKYTSEEILQMPCYNQIGEKITQKIEKLDDLLHQFEGRCLINIDRSWFFWEEIIDFINGHSAKPYILLKSAADKTLLKTLEEKGSDIMYMPIVKDEKSWELAKSYRINLVAAEIIFEDLSSELVSEGFIKTLQQEGYMTWVNAITLNDTTILSAKLDDNNAIAHGFEQNWGRLIDMGFDMIQTDWPGLLSAFVKERVPS